LEQAGDGGGKSKRKLAVWKFLRDYVCFADVIFRNSEIWNAANAAIRGGRGEIQPRIQVRGDKEVFNIAALAAYRRARRVTPTPIKIEDSSNGMTDKSLLLQLFQYLIY
jgi:hypothetical protein